MLSQWLLKTTRKSSIYQSPPGLPIYKLSKFTNCSKTVILISHWSLLSKKTHIHTHTRISCHLNLLINQWRLISLREAESNGIRRGRNSACLLGLWGCRLSPGWKEVTLPQWPPSPELSRENECGWAFTPGTWHLQTPWSLFRGSKRVTYIIQITTGQVFLNSRSQWISLYHHPSVTQLSAAVFALQAKGHLGMLPPSNCLLAPNTNGLFNRLSGNSLSNHTNTKGLFLPRFA